jgi:hypothetical protein
MANESSVVSDLIRQLNTRPLDSDASDALLFRPAPSEQSGRAPQAFQPLARWRAPTPVPEPPAVAVREPAAPTRRAASMRPTAPTHPRRKSAWLFIIAMVASTIAGVFGFRYLQRELDAGSASAVTPTSLPVTTPATEAAVAPPVAPPVAPIVAAAPASPEASPPTVEATAPTVAEAAPVTSTAPVAALDEAPATATKHAVHRKAPKKGKRVAKAATTKAAASRAQPASAPPAQPASAPPAATPEPTPPPAAAQPKRPAAQSGDDENPL